MPKEQVCPHCGVQLSPEDDLCEITAPSHVADPDQTFEETVPATLSLADQSLDFSQVGTPQPAHANEVGQALSAGPIAAPEPWSESPLFETSHNGAHEATPPFSPATTPESTPSPKEPEVSKSGRGFVLLASYASAMTIACLWLVWQARQRDAAATADTLPVDSRPDDRSGRLTVIPEARTTTVGKPLRIGDLTLTPLSATLGQVTLEAAKSTGGGEKKQGAEGSILLTLSLQNQSAKSTFAPLEVAFLRTPDAGPPASFIETESGTIDLYPLAESSEWRIVGQDFRELKPGESMRTLIASEPTASRNLAGTLRLRLKIHPTADTTDVVHIDIDGDSLQ
jgi:hypothetical protein